MAVAVGGDFEAVGRLERCLLLQQGLRPEQTLIDVGCGSGRLATQLRDFLGGLYVGIDIVPELLEHARTLCARDDWKFERAPGLEIPVESDSADFVTFFSVFTHLTHEETYRYLQESHRVLKPGGKVVFSFFEFRLPLHWLIFETVLNDANPHKVLNQFMDRDAIRAWAEHAGFVVAEIHDGDKPHIALDATVHFEDGREMHGLGNLGQSVCVLVKT